MKTAETVHGTGWKLRQLMADKKLGNQNVADALARLTGRNRHWTTISRWKQCDVMPKIDGIDLEALVFLGIAHRGGTNPRLTGKFRFRPSKLNPIPFKSHRLSHS